MLGPLLFTLYITYICDVSKLFHLVLFADDTKLFCSAKKVEQLLDPGETELDILKPPLNFKKLSLLLCNVNKTKYIIFGKLK